MRMRKTWAVVEWKDRPADTSGSFPMDCECGCEADIPCAPLVGGSLAAITCEHHLLFEPPGFEPPDNWIPTRLQCRNCGCRMIFETVNPEDL